MAASNTLAPIAIVSNAVNGSMNSLYLVIMFGYDSIEGYIPLFTLICYVSALIQPCRLGDLMRSNSRWPAATHHIVSKRCHWSNKIHDAINIIEVPYKFTNIFIYCEGSFISLSTQPQCLLFHIHIHLPHHNCSSGTQGSCQ